MADYTRKPQILIKRGMNVTLPGDRLSQEWFQYIQNVRGYLLGEWRQRPGMSSVLTAPAALYFINRINDNTSGTFRRILGTVAGNIYVDDITHTSTSLVDSGYYGKRYSAVISRPDRSPVPYMFIGDGQRNGKFSTTGARTEWGLAAPTSAPTVDGQGTDYAVINRGESTAGFAASVGALVTNQFIIAVNLDAVIFDSTTPGMANVAMAVTALASSVQPGMILRFIDALTLVLKFRALVQETFLAIASTTIQSIAYDSGVTGLCTIQLAGPSAGLKRDSIVQLGGTEYVRVLSVTRSVDDIPSFRCSTTATFAAGAAVAGRTSFRAYLPSDPIPPNGAYVEDSVIQWTGITPGLNTLTNATALNLAVADIQDGGLVVPRPIQGDDFFHATIQIDAADFTEIQFQFDLSGGTFDQDYFYIAIRPSDLQSSIDQTQQTINAQQLEVQRQQLEAFVKRRDQLLEGGLTAEEVAELGDLAQGFTNSLDSGLQTESGQGSSSISILNSQNQIINILIPISQFQRVGSGNFGWKDVVSFRVSIAAINPVLTQFKLSHVWMGGTHGPNSNNILPYTYVYRARNTSTGSRSNPSPPIRYSVSAERRLVNVTVPSYSDSQADVFDIFRIGGLLQQYYYVGTVPSSSPTLQDSLPDSSAIRNPIIETDRFKPWVSADLPKSGTCNVVGTSVIRSSGDVFDTRWVRGTQIIIGGDVYSFYSNPSSANAVSLNESGGSQTNVPWQIPEPALDGISYPAVFGPYAGSSAEFNFAVGDPRNPGYLYWTNGNDVESTSDVNSLELCNPSETLMNGCVLDGIIYVFSDRRAWRILPSFTGGQSGGGSDFYPQETSIGKGLCSRWALAVGDALYFVSYDGVYMSRGDAIESMTDESLAPLFRRDGANVTFSVPLSPIDFSQPDEISLIYSYDGLYLQFVGLDGNRYVGYMSFLTRGWVFDSITGDSIIRSSREIQSTTQDNVLVGTTSGRLLLRSSSVFTDAGTPISCRIWDREEIWDEPRLTKQVGDTMIDSDPANATITPTMRYDNDTSNDALSAFSGNGRDQFVRDINSGAGRIVRGASLDLTWSNATIGIPKVYAWEPAALVKPEETVNRSSDWDSGGYTGTKWVQGFRLRGDTSGLTKSFQVETDGGTFVEAFNFTANGEQVQTFWLTNPVVAHEMRIRGTDEDLWRNMGVEWIFEPEPEMAAVWETQVTSFDLPFFAHMREVMIAHRSTTDITMVVTTDGTTNTYTIANSGGQRVRSYLPVASVKAKYHKFRFTSSQPFGLWIMDMEVKAGPWGRTEAYTTQRPFGDISRTNGGARI